MLSIESIRDWVTASLVFVVMVPQAIKQSKEWSEAATRSRRTRAVAMASLFLPDQAARLVVRLLTKPLDHWQDAVHLGRQPAAGIMTIDIRVHLCEREKRGRHMHPLHPDIEVGCASSPDAPSWGNNCLPRCKRCSLLWRWPPSRWRFNTFGRIDDEVLGYLAERGSD